MAPTTIPEPVIDWSSHDSLLRQEIIETQKVQADFLKWKFVAIAGVLSVAVGAFGVTTTTEPVKPGGSAVSWNSAWFAPCLIPLICS